MATLSVASKIISYLQVKENTQVSLPRQASLSRYLVVTLSVAYKIISGDKNFTRPLVITSEI